MGEKIIVGPYNKGLKRDREPFIIDNDAFPTLINAYQWRGRIKRKRGTSLLGRLKRFYDSTTGSYGVITSFNLVGGAGNLTTAFGLQSNSNYVPGSITFTDATTGDVYTDPGADGILVGAPAGSGTIDYATGAITVAGGGGDLINTVTFLTYPTLPVMGLEDLILTSSDFPATMAFDTDYSYIILNNYPYDIYDVSFYKNPTTGTYTGYTEKTAITPTTWTGEDYQQFWTANYQGALWATNGITIPFTVTQIGMPYKAVTNISMIVAGPPATARFTIPNHGLGVGEFLFFNEFSTGVVTGLNFQTGYVINRFDANNLDVEFPNATLGGAGGATTQGIAQYLTNRPDTSKDCLRWYDGDPTDGNATTPTLNGHKGWVNFCPPLSEADFSIGDLPEDQYYLVGCRIIFPFKDRILFIGPVVQTSTAGSQIYLPDTIIFSQNGTPYYTASFTGDVTDATVTYHPILTPTSQTATANAYFEDVAGYGGFISSGLNIPITTAGANEDSIILGFNERKQARMIYTGNDLFPFNLFLVNSELSSSSTFSSVVMDRGIYSIGNTGILIANQTEASRIDIEIPDEIFQFSLKSNGFERVTAQRDYINEWIYFTYPFIESTYKFPNQTLQYNYRETTWGIFKECYTTYGQFNKTSGLTWSTVGDIYPTWSEWTVPWRAGASTIFQPDVIAGNQQGFVLFRDSGTDEGKSIYIQSFSGSVITSPDHCLENGDYIVINDCIGTISSEVNGKIFSVINADTNTFQLNPGIGAGTYFGAGTIIRMSVPYIQTKQFPASWGISRKTRIGPQQYLFTTTANGQLTLLIFLSQNSAYSYNSGPIVPSVNVKNNSLIYSTVLYTCQESVNLGLTVANTNLLMFSEISSDGTNAANPQAQIWHRMNTSLIGDTVQIGFTLSDDQMRDTDFASQFTEIELHGFILDVTPSMMLA